MRIVIITQDDPFFLRENIDFLLSNIPVHSRVVGCVVFKPSPFGKKMSYVEKIKTTAKVFGFRFLLYYSCKVFINKLKFTSLHDVLKKHRVPILKITGSINSASSLQIIRSVNPDLVISIAGNQIFKDGLINLAPKGCLNLHTSLLPKYRGLMPSFWVLKNDEEYTGVSVFFVDKGIDSGPIIVQKKLKIGDMGQQHLIRHTKQLGMESVIEAVNKIHDGNYSLLENDNSKMSYYSFPTAADVAEFKRRGKRFF